MADNTNEEQKIQAMPVHTERALFWWGDSGSERKRENTLKWFLFFAHLLIKISAALMVIQTIHTSCSTRQSGKKNPFLFSMPFRVVSLPIRIIGGCLRGCVKKAVLHNTFLRQTRFFSPPLKFLIDTRRKKLRADTIFPFLEFRITQGADRQPWMSWRRGKNLIYLCDESTLSALEDFSTFMRGGP